MDQAHHAEWKGNSGKATESGFRAWFWFLGQQSGKHRLRCHFFVRKGDPRERDGGREERAQEGWGAGPECALGAGHGLVTDTNGWSVSQDCPLRSCINSSFSAQSFRGEGEENVSTGSHQASGHSQGVNCWEFLNVCGWMQRLIALMSTEAPKARSVGPEARGCWVVRGQSWPGSRQKWRSQQHNGLVANGPKISESVQSGT